MHTSTNKNYSQSAVLCLSVYVQLAKNQSMQANRGQKQLAQPLAKTSLMRNQISESSYLLRMNTQPCDLRLGFIIIMNRKKRLNVQILFVAPIKSGSW